MNKTTKDNPGGFLSASLLLLFTATIIILFRTFDSVNLTRFGILLESIGGLLATPELISLIVDKEKLSQFQKKVSNWSEDISSKATGFVEHFSKLWDFDDFPDEKNYDIQDNPVGYFMARVDYYSNFILPTLTFPIISLSALLIFVFKRDLKLAVILIFINIFLSMYFNTWYSLIAPAIAKNEEKYKLIDVLSLLFSFLVRGISILIFFATSLLAVFLSLFPWTAILLFAGISSSLVWIYILTKNVLYRRKLPKEHKGFFLISPISFSEIFYLLFTKVFINLYWLLSFPFVGIGDAFVKLIVYVITRLSLMIVNYFTYPIRSNQLKYLGLLSGILMIITGNALEFLSTWK